MALSSEPQARPIVGFPCSSGYSDLMAASATMQASSSDEAGVCQQSLFGAMYPSSTKIAVYDIWFTIAEIYNPWSRSVLINIF